MELKSFNRFVAVNESKIKFGLKGQYTYEDINDIYGFWGTLDSIGYKTKQIEDAWLSAFAWLCESWGFSDGGALHFLNSKAGRWIADQFYDKGGDEGVDVLDVLERYATPREWKKWAKEHNTYAQEQLAESLILENEILYDTETREPIFIQGEKLTLSKFLAKARKSAEAKKAYKWDSNFGKGMKMAEALKKNLNHLPFVCTVYRSAWNYGENLMVDIKLGGKNYNETMFKFGSANSTRQPTYSFSPIFQGTTKLSTGKVEDQWDMGTIHGSYQSISSFDKFIDDVVHVFNDYERVNGEPFSFKSAMKAFKEKAKLRQAWNKIEPKLEKEYYAAKENARKVSRWIEMRMPRLDTDKKTVYFKHDEPREFRHPDEYGEVPEMETKEYAKYEKHIANVSNILDKFCNKFGVELVWAASW